MTLQPFIVGCVVLVLLTLGGAVVLSARRNAAPVAGAAPLPPVRAIVAFEAGAMRSGMGFPIPHFYAGSAGPIVGNALLTRGRQPTPTRQTGRSADDVAQAAGPAPELVLR